MVFDEWRNRYKNRNDISSRLTHLTKGNTRLAESGLEPKVLQYIMGHANVSVTLDVYTHLDFTQIQEKMEAVQENMRIG